MIDPSSTNKQETMFATGPQTLPKFDVLAGIILSSVCRPPRSINSGGRTAQSGTSRRP